MAIFLPSGGGRIAEGDIREILPSNNQCRHVKTELSFSENASEAESGSVG
jgi:hypothetical protein